MTSTLKRSISTILAFVMMIGCIIVVNTAKASGAVPEKIFKFYANKVDATKNGDDILDNATDVFTDATTGTLAFTEGNYEVNGKSYTLTKSASKTSYTIVVPDAVTDATLYMVIKTGTYATSMSLNKDEVVIDNTKKLPANKTDVIIFNNLSGGTYTLTSNRDLYTSLLVLATSPFHTLSGKLTDSAGKPIKNGAITTSNGLITNTDVYGSYSLNLPDGINEVTVSSMGYVSKKENIVIENDIIRNFKLEKDTSIGEIYKFYGNKTDAETNGDSIDDNATDIFTYTFKAKSDSNVNTVTTGGLFNIGGSCYELNYAGTSSKVLSFIKVPEGVKNADLYLVFKSTERGTSAYLSKDENIVGDKILVEKSTTQVVEYKGLSEGTYTFTTMGRIYPSLFVLTTSSTYRVSGTVNYDTGESVKCATVYIDDEMKGITDDRGRYSIITQAGRHDIKVTALGSSDVKDSFVLDKDTTMDFTLNKSKNMVYKFYGIPNDAKANYDNIDINAAKVFTNAVANTDTGIMFQETFNIGGSSYRLTNHGRRNNKFTVVVPDTASDAELYMVFTQCNSGKIVKFSLMKNGKVVDNTQVLKMTPMTPTGMIHYKGLSAGTYTVVSSDSVSPSLFLLNT